MKTAAILPVLLVSLFACSESPTGITQPEELTTLESLADNPNATPISYVSTFAEFVSIDVRENGNSSRTRENDLVLVFDVTGDLVGTETVVLNNNNGIDKVGFATSHQQAVTEVCWPARGLCGSFEGIGAGKVTSEGIDFPIAISHGTGGFEGMILKGEFLECPDSNGDKGCFTGFIIE